MWNPSEPRGVYIVKPVFRRALPERKVPMQTSVMLRRLLTTLLLALLTACSSTAVALAPTPADSRASTRTPDPSPTETTSANACQVTEPEWLKPADDPAVQNPPDFGHYFVNQDLSIWASAWWPVEEEQYPRLNKEGFKVGWFRPEGAPLEITGRRIDGQAPRSRPRSCCYPTDFKRFVFSHRGC
jgi:hypothetical protein